LSALWLVAAAACGHSPPPAKPAVGPAVDERTARSDAKGVVTEIYRTIDRGKTDSLFSLVSNTVIVFGPRRADAMVTRSDALVALGAAIDKPRGAKGKARAPLRSGGLAVVVSQGGHSAWAFDVVNLEGHALAMTAVLSNTDDIWAVTAAVVAETPASRDAKAESARDAIVPPGATAIGKQAPGTGDAVDKLRKGLLNQQLWGDELASQSDAIVAGPTLGDVARGPKAIKRLWTARLKANLREAAAGEPSAALTPDGQLAWVSLPVTRVSDGDDPTPLRLFAVYQKDGAAWKLVVLHESLAVDEPGTGTALKKIVPPAIAPAKPEPPKADPAPAKSDETAAAKPKKKPAKKKKPKPPAE
jgi:hypothetical protein